MMTTKIAAYAFIFMSLLTACSTEISSAEYLDRAKAHYKKGAINSATIEARNSVKANTESPEARVLLAELELLNLNAAGSEKELLKAIDLGTSQSTVTAMLSQALIEQNKYEELNQLKTDDLQEMDKAYVLSNQAMASVSMGNNEQATAKLQSAIVADPTSREAYLVKSLIALNNNDLDSARKNIDTTLQHSPNYGNAWTLLGNLELAQNNTNEAIDAYSKAIEYSSNKLEPLLKRATILVQTEDFEAAKLDLKALRNNGVNHPWVNQLYSAIHMNNGSYLDAQLELEKTLKSFPDYVPALTKIASIHFQVGNLGQAEQYAKKSLIASDAPSTRTLLGAIRLQNKRYEQTETTLAPLLINGDASPLSFKLLSTAYLKQGRYEDAISTMLQLHNTLKLAGQHNASDLTLKRSPIEEFSTEVIATHSSEPYLTEIEQNISQVIEFIANNQPTDALSLIEDLKSSMPDSPTPYNLMGLVSIQTENLTAADQAFRQALDANKSSAFSSIMLSRVLLVDDPNGAKAVLEQALRYANGSKREDILLTLAAQTPDSENWQKKLTAFEQVHNEFPRSFKANFEIAKLKYLNENYDDVLTIVSTMSENEQLFRNVFELQINAKLQLKLYDEVLTSLDKRIIKYPTDSSLYLQRASAYSGLLDKAKTIENLNEALRLAPDNPPTLVTAANYYINQNDLVSAQSYIDKIESLVPDTKALPTLKGKFIKAKKQSESPSNKVELKNTDDVMKLVQDLWSKDRKSEAIKLMTSWLEANPLDERVRMTLANVYGNLEREEDAIAAYQDVLEKQPENFTALNNLAWYLRNTDPALAEKHVKKALAIQPDNIATIDTLAVILLLQNKIEQAQTAFYRTQELGAKDPAILLHGAQIEYELENYSKAYSLLHPIIQGKYGTDFAEINDAKALFEKIEAVKPK